MKLIKHFKKKLINKHKMLFHLNKPTLITNNKKMNKNMNKKMNKYMNKRMNKIMNKIMNKKIFKV